MIIEYEKIFLRYECFDISIRFMFYSPKDSPELERIVEGLWHEVRESFPKNSSARTLYRGKEHLKTILCNLYMAWLSRKCLAVSRNNNDYTKKGAMGKFHVNPEIFIGILDYLTEQEYVGFKKGIHFQDKAYTSRYWSLPKLYEKFKNCKPDDIVPVKQRSQVVVLKDSNKPPKEIRYKHTQETLALKDQIERINWGYDGHVFNAFLPPGIMSSRIIRLHPHLVSIFNRERWELGGRLYDRPKRGFCYQQLSKEMRKEILIDTQPTVERDFSSLHINMLYAKIGQQLHKDGYGFLPPKYRGVAKKFMMSLLNAESEKDAIGSMNKKRYDLICLGDIRSDSEDDMLKLLDSLNFKAVLKAAKAYHQPIAEFFCSGVGLSLQNQDSKMALDIISSLMRRGIVVLPMHDSFIVRREYDTELQTTMQAVYKAHNNGFSCSVD